MNTTTISNAVQAPILKTYEQSARLIAQKYRTKLQEASKAHRRTRYVSWYTWLEDADVAWAMVVDYFASRGECEPEVLTSDEEDEIIGLCYDRLTNEEKAAFDKIYRRECTDDYLDDYYRDELIAIRDEWNQLIRDLESPGYDYNTQSYVIRAKYSPGVFHCLVCGAFSYSHDETGALIAKPGLWAMSDGSLGNYTVCECCKDKPDETNQALAKYFAECTEFQRAEAERMQREFEEYLRAEGIDPDADPDIDDGQTGQTSSTASGQQSTSGSQSTATGTHTPRFNFLRYDAFMQRPPKAWKIENIIGERDLVTVFGEAGSGKTFIVIDLIYSASLGRDWVREYDPTNSRPGKFRIARPLTVAYSFGEGGAGLPDRFRAAQQYYGKPLSDVFFVDEVPQLYKSTDPSSVNTFIADYVTAQNAGQVPALDLLIIDTQANATLGADENSSSHMAEVIANAQKAIKVLGCAVILIHHATKNGGSYRGSSVLHGAADCMIEVKKTESGERAISCYKLKDGTAWDAQKFTILAHSTPNGAYVAWEGDAAKGGKRQTDDDTVVRLLQNNPGQRFTANQVESLTGISRTTAGRVLGRLTARGQVCHETIQKGSKDISQWYYDFGIK